jgi:hypothetical protein
MQDILSQMVLKWARFGPDRAIDVPDDFTRLTLDSIAMFVIRSINFRLVLTEANNAFQLRYG